MSPRAIMLSPVLSGLIATHAGGWRAVVFATVLFGALALIASLFYKETNLQRDPQAGRIKKLLSNYALLLKGSSLRSLVFHELIGPSVIGLMLPQMVLTLGAGMVLPGAVAGAVIPNPNRAGLAAGFIGFAQMAGATISGRLQDDSAFPMVALNAAFAVAGFLAFRIMRARRTHTAKVTLAE